jgi:hypothetical protein
MADDTSDANQPHGQKGQKLRIRLPGFVAPEEDLGLGTAIKRMTYVLGIKSCGGCDRRAIALDRRVTLSGRRFHGN